MRPLIRVIVLTLPAVPMARASGAVAPALMLEAVQGDGAIHNVRERFFVEPVVRVTDQGKPVAGAVVSFLAPQVGAGATFPEGPILTVSTGEDGTATARGLRPNAVVGQWELRVAASHGGRTARLTMLQTNAAPAEAARARSRSRTYLILGAVAGGALAGAVAALSGGAAAAAVPAPAAPLPPAAAVNPPTVITPGGGSFGPPPQ